MATVRLARESEWDAGIDVVIAAHRSTSFPIVGDGDEDELARTTRRRQTEALAVWIAVDGALVVGHGLIQQVDQHHPSWRKASQAEVRQALLTGRLLSLGGLAVDPAWTRRGIGRELVRTRLQFGYQLPGSVIGASIWRHSVGSVRLAREFGSLCMPLEDELFDLYLYDQSRIDAPRTTGGTA